MGETISRDFCARCAIKHLAQASILLKESALGYPVHVYYAMGHMAEASDELVAGDSRMANRIRDERLKIEDGLRTGNEYFPQFKELMMDVAHESLLEETWRNDEDE